MPINLSPKTIFNSKAPSIAVIIVFVGVFAVLGLKLRPPSHASGLTAPTSGTPICGQAILNSPYSYNGAAGTFTTSGTPAGLPTFGSAGTNFPSATKIVVVPTGDNTAAASSYVYSLANAIIYFEPGIHTIQSNMFTGHDSVFIGGYTPGTGKAIIDGINGAQSSDNLGGHSLSLSTPSSGTSVNNIWEYLTIRNYSSVENDAVMGDVAGGGNDDGDTYMYNTIGPNEYGWHGVVNPAATGESNGGGYAINLGSHTTVQYNCLTQDAQGAFNGSGVADVNISNNEISRDGLGEYPDTGGAGASPYGCGCSGGGKLFFSVNASVTDNYVHDNYNAGIWFDWNNTGANISGNYIASNWSAGIDYEASYNANISNNTLVGNGWASDGAWPAGLNGGACGSDGSQFSCSLGSGPIAGASWGNPYTSIYIANSGGNSNMTTVKLPGGGTENSNYAGQLLVQGNVLKDNFGGISVYTDTNRYPLNIDADSSCGEPLGAMDAQNSPTYYHQSNVLQTNADSTVSGNSITSSGGTTTLCDNYGSPGTVNANENSVLQAPSVGMAVFDQNSGAFLGTVASVSSAKAFTLSGSPGNESGASLLLSAYGGCGPADYYGGGLNKLSGQPAALYWDNCIWGARNVTVSGNTFSLDANTVPGCTTANMCGFMANVAFNAGVPALMGFFDSYANLTANASGGLGNVWSNNAYTWSGGGPGQWQFWAGLQGNQVTKAQWQAVPLSQDAGSTFNASPTPPPSPGGKVGDLNGDGSVNITDLSIFLSAWGTNNSAISSNLGTTGPINITDLSIFLSHWGT